MGGWINFVDKQKTRFEYRGTCRASKLIVNFGTQKLKLKVPSRRRRANDVE